MNILRIGLANLAVAAILFSATSCGGRLGETSGQGELIGYNAAYGDRPQWFQVLPYGMSVVPSGTFHMGQSDEDVPATNINFNKQITIGGFYMDDSEITNDEYRQFIRSMMDGEVETGETDLTLERDDLLPDTGVWKKDFAHHLGDPLMEYYWSHPAFDLYPVVGVSWKQAKLFCVWRTRAYNQAREAIGQQGMPGFRLPSEAEWEFAARGGRDLSPYPWGGPYVRNTKGCMLANFKPGRGNYYDDGFSYTSPAYSYFANDYGLFDMSGNVAEWCEDAYAPNAFPIVWDMNPTYFDEDEPRKIIRGGSWKDIGYYLRTGTRSFDFEDSASSYVGFRCAVTYLGRSSGAEF